MQGCMGKIIFKNVWSNIRSVALIETSSITRIMTSWEHVGRYSGLTFVLNYLLSLEDSSHSSFSSILDATFIALVMSRETLYSIHSISVHKI